MNVLAIDTTHSTGSLFLKTPSEEVFLKWESEKSHSEILFEQVQAALKKSHIEIQDIHSLLVNHGPGSFTGIRIGINFVRAISYSLKIPIYQYNSLEILAHQNQENGLLVAINAHSSLSYFKNFNSPSSKIEVLSISQVQDQLNTSSSPITGDFFSLYQDQLTWDPSRLLKNQTLSHAKQLYSLHHTHPTSASSWSEATPFYIRKSAPEEKRNL